MTEGCRHLQDVRFEPCPAMVVAHQVLRDLWTRTGAAALERNHIQDLTHFIYSSGEPLPEVVQSRAANLGFVCEGRYPKEPLDEDPVTLQTKFEPDQGYQLVVYLRGRCCPSPEERRELIGSGRLQRLRPRRTVEEFVERDRCPPLVTDWSDEAGFREAVVEAVELFLLRI